MGHVTANTRSPKGRGSLTCRILLDLTLEGNRTMYCRSSGLLLLDDMCLLSRTSLAVKVEGQGSDSRLEKVGGTFSWDAVFFLLFPVATLFDALALELLDFDAFDDDADEGVDFLD